MIEVYFSLIIMAGDKVQLQESPNPMSSYSVCVDAGKVALELFDNVIGYQCNVFYVEANHEKKAR